MSFVELTAGRALAQDEAQTLETIQSRIAKLLHSRIARNHYHHLKETAQDPASFTGLRLERILEGLQKAIHQWIDKIEGSQAAEPPAPVQISWTEENIRLQVFYSYLRNKPVTGQAYKLCEAIRIDADRKIYKLQREESSSLAEFKAKQTDIISVARKWIGRVVFAADRVPQKLIAGIDLSKLEGTLQFVEEVVDGELKSVSYELDEKWEAAIAFNLQDSDTVRYTETPKEIAKLLLTAKGQLNLGMISSIKTHFFPFDCVLLEYQEGIVFVLDRLDISWQKAIDAVQVPASPSTASNAMVRADMGLLPGEEITKLHCQQEILGALLSQLCQGPVGDCFAVSWAIKKHEEFLFSSLEDYIALVRDGYLARAVNGKPDQFFFERTIVGESTFMQITLNPDGTLADLNGTAFWECPNLIAACRQMGIADLEKRKDALLYQIFGSQDSAKTMTWDALIQACASNVANPAPAGSPRLIKTVTWADQIGSGSNYFSAPKATAEELLVLGRYGFNLSNNRLLRAWETSLAAMAEARPGDYVRDNISNSVMAVFASVFASREKRVTLYQKALIEEVKKVLRKTLNDSFRLVYNGSIPLAHVSSDGSSSSGGFELYQRDLKDLTNKGVRIATPEQFKAFILSVIEQAQSAEVAKVASKKDRLVVASVAQALYLCAISGDFMKKVLYAYDDANKHDPDPVAHYRNLERTPMTSLDGDNPWEVMAIDTGKDFAPDIKTIRPQDPGDLLKWLLGLAQWKESTEHYLSDAISDEEDSATSPQHAFNIEIEGPEFKDFLVSKLSTDAWIEKILIDPGLQVSRAEIDKGAKLLFQKNVKGWLSAQLQDGIPDSLEHEMDNFFSTLVSKVMTVQQFAQRSQDGLVGILRLNADRAKAISLALDAMLLQSLSSAQSRAIQQESVRFAKTNWNEGPKNLFFCCFFNPRTEKVDFGSITEDKTGLQPMDQLEWSTIKNGKWTQY